MPVTAITGEMCVHVLARLIGPAQIEPRTERGAGDSATFSESELVRA